MSGFCFTNLSQKVKKIPEVVTVFLKNKYQVILLLRNRRIIDAVHVILLRKEFIISPLSLLLSSSFFLYDTCFVPGCLRGPVSLQNICMTSWGSKRNLIKQKLNTILCCAKQVELCP